MYYVWQSDAGLSKSYLYASDVPEGLRHKDWDTGKALVKQPAPITLVGDNDSPATLSDMVLTQFELPVLSPRAISVLEDVGVKNLGYYPIHIKHKKMRETEKSYQIANIIGLVVCLDKKHAKFKTFPEDKNAISWLEKYRLLEDKIGKKGPLIFRLGEYPSHALVHESVKTAFEKAGLTGAKFTPTEKFA